MFLPSNERDKRRISPLFKTRGTMSTASSYHKGNLLASCARYKSDAISGAAHLYSGYALSTVSFYYKGKPLVSYCHYKDNVESAKLALQSLQIILWVSDWLNQ